MWPRAVSTLGRLKRLKRDILDGVRSALGAGVVVRGAGMGDAGWAAASRKLVVDRVKRHLEPVDASWARLRRLLEDRNLERSSGAMDPVGVYTWAERAVMGATVGYSEPKEHARIQAGDTGSGSVFGAGGGNVLGRTASRPLWNADREGWLPAVGEASVQVS